MMPISPDMNCCSRYENFFISQMEPDHKMDKRLKIAEIAARTQLSISTVSRVLAGKANTSEKARVKVLDCARALGVMDAMAAGRLLLNSLVVFAPQRAFDERSDIFYYRVIQSVGKALASHEVRLRYCALEENDSDSQLFLARMNEPDTQAAILLGIDDPHIHDLAVDVGKPCMLINCRDRLMRLPAVAPDHRVIGERAAEYLFEMGHREVMSVLCLRRYTMELRLAGIRDAWQSHNLKFNDKRVTCLKRAVERDRFSATGRASHQYQPLRFEQCLAKALLLGRVHSQLIELMCLLHLLKQPQHNFLAAATGQGRDTKRYR
jgi:DNA-binding LacI/PurR family transcriptional regulator